jgi:hypothetical protein
MDGSGSEDENKLDDLVMAQQNKELDNLDIMYRNEKDRDQEDDNFARTNRNIKPNKYTG